MPNAVWDVTSKCNLNCQHCYNLNKYSNSSYSDLSYAECMQFISFLSENNCKVLSLLGGEPLLHPNIRDILLACKQKGIAVVITTNGTLLDDEMISVIMDSSVTDVLVSLDGSEASVNDAIRGDGVFSMVTNNISRLINAIRESASNISVSIAYSMTSLNFKSSRDMVMLCKNLRVGRLNITSIINAGGANNNWEDMKLDTFRMLNAIEDLVAYSCEIYPTLSIVVDARPLVAWYLNRKYPANVTYSLGFTKCQVLDQLIYVTADGHLHPCGIYDMEIGKEAQRKGFFDSKDTFKIDPTSSVEDIYASKYYRDFLSSMKQLYKGEYHKNCVDCPVREDCFPCPYQFDDGVADCDWVSEKLNQITSDVSCWNVVRKHEVPEKYIPDENLKFLYSMLKTGSTVAENYACYVKASNQAIDIFDYLNMLNVLERKFILKTKRG